MAYAVRLSQFEGPLNLLLELIEQEKLDITQVALANVTDSFLHHIEGNADIPPEDLTDFLVVASRLLLIKSKLLLPFLHLHDEEEEGMDLESQLKIFKEYLEASKKVERMIAARRFLFAHDRLPKMEIGFSPPAKLATGDMKEFLLGVIRRLEPIVTVPVQQVLERNVSIHDKITHIRTALAKVAKVSFRKLISEAESKTEIIVSFLALLELVKQRHIMVSQDARFDDITITSIETTANV